MPGPKGNQPISSGSNHNQQNTNKSRPPKHNKKLSFQKYKKSGRSAAKRVDNKQSAMINALSKQVYKLQMAQYGKVQQNYHVQTAPLFLERDRPCCLDLTDFTCERGPEVAGIASSDGALIYQLQPPNQSPTQAQYWRRKPPNVTYGHNLYWNNQNQDQPDTGAYLALGATYFVEVKGLPVANNVRVRFDVVSQKPDAILPAERVNNVTPITKLLPDTLPHMRRLANPTENRINPTYFHKYFSKTVFLNSTKAEDTKGTTANIMRFSFKIKPNKLCVQSETNPQVGGGIVENDNPPPDTGIQPEYPRGNFGPRNVPATQPLWMLITSDNELDDQERIQVVMSRRIVWRDHLGSSNL